jgi:hypothetical protein
VDLLERRIFLTENQLRRYGDASRPRDNDRMQMKFSEKTRAIVTDSHFLIPLAVFFIGLALLIALH